MLNSELYSKIYGKITTDLINHKTTRFTIDQKQCYMSCITSGLPICLRLYWEIDRNNEIPLYDFYLKGPLVIGQMGQTNIDIDIKQMRQLLIQIYNQIC